MICGKCGRKIIKGEKFCSNCGSKAIVNNNMVNTVVNTKNSNKNGLRKASVVLGIISLVGVFFIIFSPLSLVISLIGLVLGLFSLKKGRNGLGITLNSVGLGLSLLICSAFLILLDMFGIKFDSNNKMFVDQDVILSLDNNNITEDDLYDMMKGNYSIETLLMEVDDIILSKMYPEDKEMKKEIKETALYYYSMYESYYGYTKEEFLSNTGFESEEEFYDVLRLDYRRNLYLDDYVRDMVSEKDINNYYKNDVYGDINSKHILVKVDESGIDGYNKKDAMNIALEIINKLDNGMSWDSVINEYKNKIVSEELGYMAFNVSLEDAYLEECRNLENGKYSSEPILTSYGYHIVYKIDEKDKPKLDEVKEEIVDVLVNNIKVKDENLLYKALIELRQDKGLIIHDTDLMKEYKEKYIDMYK